jgi:hypothetical protein
MVPFSADLRRGEAAGFGHKISLSPRPLNGFALMVANAAHIKNVPGRKTDLNDAMWIADLLACGLIKASFVPPGDLQELRALLRARKQLVREQTSHVQRLQKTLEEANIKLAVISDIIGAGLGVSPGRIAE